MITCFTTRLLTPVLLILLLWIAPAALARAPKVVSAKRMASTSLPQFEQPATLDECFHLDKHTGQLVPCTTSGSGGSGGTSSSPVVSTAPPPAFDYFDATYGQADFDDEPESVLPNAYLLSQLSAVSYAAPGDGEGEAYRIAEDLGLQTLPVIEDEFHSLFDIGGPGGATKAYVFYNDDAVFLTFEGTTGVLEWEETNIDLVPHAKPEWGATYQNVCYVIGCFQVPVAYVTIHGGFYDAMDIVFDEVREAIEPLLETNSIGQSRELWITGHSLGGAVAVLTAFRLQFDHDITVQGVHTFGAPAVGDGLWAEVFDGEMSNVHRWNLEHDPAPVAAHWPMFTHVGIANNLYGDGTLGLDEAALWYYVPECAPGYSIYVVHMSYWPRMHDELSVTHPELIPLLPESLLSPVTPDDDDPCYW